jgi:hypothetical protein
MKKIVIGAMWAALACCLVSCNGGGNGEDADAGDPAAEDAAADDAFPDPVEGDQEIPEDVQADEGQDIADVPAEEIEENAASVFCLQMTDAFCDYVTACCNADEQSALAALVVDCAAPEGSAFFHACYDGIGPYVVDGTAEIYDAAVPGCLAIFSDMASSCPDFNAAPMNRTWYMDAGCSEVVRGLLSPSEDCYDSEQCPGSGTSSYYCDLGSSPSTCQPRKTQGTACTVNDECMAGDVCVSDACSAHSSADGPCDEDDDCDLGTYCDVDGGAVCREMLDAGTECDTTDDLCAGRCMEGDPPTCAAFCDGI